MSFPDRTVERRRRLAFPSSSCGVAHSAESRLARLSLDSEKECPGLTMDQNVHSQHDHPSEDQAQMNAAYVSHFLHENQHFLDEFIAKHVKAEQVQQWVKQKAAKSSQLSLSIEDVTGKHRKAISQSRYGSRDIISLQKTLSNLVKTQSDLLPLLHEVAHVIGTGIGAEGVAFYCLRSGGKELALYVPNRDVPSNYQLVPQGQVGEGSTIAAFTAYSKEALFMADILSDDRFPHGVCIGREDNEFQAIICLPVTLPSEDILGVFQFTKGWDHVPFSKANMQMALALVTWVGNTLHAAQVNETLAKQLDLEDFLLDVSKVIFDDMTKLDKVSEKIMAFTKELVNAERCALFLVNNTKGELYSNMFDEGHEKNGKPIFRKSDEISHHEMEIAEKSLKEHKKSENIEIPGKLRRDTLLQADKRVKQETNEKFSISKGIAGFVARSHEIVNIRDAYRDARFNREIDIKTGFTTRNILCMPIEARNEVVGVIQMINKKSGNCFTNADESSFKMFSVFCALALHYSKLYKEMQYKGAQLDIALEQISHHFICPAEEVAKAKAKYAVLTDEDFPNLQSFYFYPVEDRDLELLPQYFVHMVNDLLGSQCFDYDKLWYFTLTVKRNYRDLPYHNWTHGFNVVHCMYCMLKVLKHRKVFSQLMIKALLIGSICHDVDHRGFNNSFLAKLEDPLAQLYSTSVMEQHHYNHTVTILQQENHNIFGDLEPEDYKKVLGYIKSCILATDLALYIPIQKALSKAILTNDGVDFDNPDHYRMTVSLMMTGADLVAVVKPFPTQKHTLKCIYEEFYNQGDKEKEMGLRPIPMMDRDYEENQPKDQCGFITFICEPCYKTLSEIFPELSPLLEGCRENFQQWQCVIEGKSTSMWEPASSIPKVAKHT